MTVALLKYYERNQQKSQTKFMKTGYSIRTWRMRLVCPEPIWLDRTEEYFQNVVEFYYHLLRQHGLHAQAAAVVTLKSLKHVFLLVYSARRVSPTFRVQVYE